MDPWRDGIHVMLRAAKRGAALALEPDEERVVLELIATVLLAQAMLTPGR